MRTGVRRSWWFPRVVVAGVLLAAGVALARYEHVTPDAVRLPLVIAAGVFLVGLAVDVSATRTPDWDVSEVRSVNPVGQDPGLNRNVRLLENHLTSRTVEPLVQQRLTLLADARLAELGLRRGEPGVDDRLGPTLCDVIDSAPRQLGRGTIEECIRRIEELSP